MIEITDVTRKYHGRIVPIIHPGIESVTDWGFVHAAAGGKLDELNRATAASASCAGAQRRFSQRSGSPDHR